MFAVKKIIFKIFIFILSQIGILCQIFIKSCFIILLMSGLAISIVHSDLFIFDNVICPTLKVPTIRFLLYIGN